ncbi:MAG: NADH-quinone oxidoreductase subunit NuoH [Planctomycetes bacterium]|nr:NADH-quinone oxidoreductase subunit NuoH [Planctomycetota bacterium]
MAAIAVAFYRIFGPIVRRLAPVIFFGGVIGGCVAVWLVAVLMGTYGDVEDQLVRAGTIDRGQTVSIAQIGSGIQDLRTAATNRAIRELRRERLDEAAFEARREQLEQGTPELRLMIPAWLLWPFQSGILRDIIGVTGVVTFVAMLAMFAIWGERKVAGHIQSRVGPMRVGGWHGWAQSMADGIKCVTKEDTVPENADRPLFLLAPYLTFVPVLAAYMALPFGLYWVFRELDVALLFILAMLNIEVMGVLIAGWASNNKWSMLGAMREACQMVSYEIPLGMSLLIPIMVVGTLQLSEVAEYQRGGWFNWLAWHSPWTFIAMFTYFIASLASCKRAPFDLPEAESELVAGFHTEYSGYRWAVFFFAEYAGMFIVSGLLVILFLGAWDAPWVATAPEGMATSARLMDRLIYGVVFSGPIWFILKGIFFIYVHIWMRWTLPRLRIDQVLYSCIQVILPLTMVALLASVFWELAVRSPQVFRVAQVITFLLGVIGALLALGILYVAAVGFSKRRELPGTQAVNRLLPGG